MGNGLRGRAIVCESPGASTRVHPTARHACYGNGRHVCWLDAPAIGMRHRLAPQIYLLAVLVVALTCAHIGAALGDIV